MILSSKDVDAIYEELDAESCGGMDEHEMVTHLHNLIETTEFLRKEAEREYQRGRGDFDGL